MMKPDLNLIKTAESGARKLMEEGLIFPEQMFAEVSPSERWGQAALLAAVLDEGILNFLYIRQPSDEDGAELERERVIATHWIMSDTTSLLFSFVSICDALGLDPQYLRKGLQLKRRAMLAEAAKSGSVNRSRGRRARATAGRGRTQIMDKSRQQKARPSDTKPKRRS